MPAAVHGDGVVVVVVVAEVLESAVDEGECLRPHALVQLGRMSTLPTDTTQRK